MTLTAITTPLVRRLRRVLVVRTISAAVVALLLAWILNRLHARYTCDPSVNAIWPAQVIFGFYLVILGLCVQALEPSAKRADPRPSGAALRRLFLLVLTGLCLDLVFVNYTEAQKDEPGFYRLVVLWDFFVFFAWLRAIDLAKDAPIGKFLTAPLVAIAPLLKLGREVLFLPYGAWAICAKSSGTCPPGQSVWADLVFGDLAVCFWLFVVLGRLASPGTRLERLGSAATPVVFFGCVYWILKAAEYVAQFVVPHCLFSESGELIACCVCAALAWIVTRLVVAGRFPRIGAFVGVSRR